MRAPEAAAGTTGHQEAGTGATEDICHIRAQRQHWAPAGGHRGNRGNLRRRRSGHEHRGNGGNPRHACTTGSSGHQRAPRQNSSPCFPASTSSHHLVTSELIQSEYPLHPGTIPSVTQPFPLFSMMPGSPLSKAPSLPSLTQSPALLRSLWPLQPHGNVSSPLSSA